MKCEACNMALGSSRLDSSRKMERKMLQLWARVLAFGPNRLFCTVAIRGPCRQSNRKPPFQISIDFLH